MRTIFWAQYLWALRCINNRNGPMVLGFSIKIMLACLLALLDNTFG